MYDIDQITGMIIDAAYRIHSHFGPGLLESAYEMILVRELEKIGLQVERQKSISFTYDDMDFNDAFRVDLLVEKKIVVELKSTEELAPVHYKQVLTYLKLLNLPVGLLINFGGNTLKEGIHRIVNGYTPSTHSELRINQNSPK